jgi:acyl-CoA reductase-like NAD-dependent aldehyde dehydrogenase
VYPVDTMQEAARRANAIPFAFQAAVLTRDFDTALAAFELFDASTVLVNDHTAFRVDWMPFAGLKRSGLGVGGIGGTIRDMQVERMLVMRRLPGDQA